MAFLADAPWYNFMSSVLCKFQGMAQATCMMAVHVCWNFSGSIVGAGLDLVVCARERACVHIRVGGC